MTVSTYDPIWIRGKGRFAISGMFYPQAAGTPLFGSTALAASASGVKAGTGPGLGASSASGWSVARTGVGLFVLTVKDANVAELISGVATVGLAALANTFCQLGAVVLTAGVATVTIAVATGGVAAEIAANADARISFNLLFRRSSVRG